MIYAILVDDHEMFRFGVRSVILKNVYEIFFINYFTALFIKFLGQGILF